MNSLKTFALETFNFVFIYNKLYIKSIIIIISNLILNKMELYKLNIWIF